MIQHQAYNMSIIQIFYFDKKILKNNQKHLSENSNKQTHLREDVDVLVV